MTFTADNISLDSLGIPKDEITERHFPEAREAAIKMMDMSLFFYTMPEQAQHLALGMFIMGYISKASADYKHW